MDEAKDRFYACMAAYDGYFLTKVHKYNLDMAVFYARNRLTSWASGQPLGMRPEEDMDNFIPYKLCRDMSGPATTALAGFCSVD